MSEEILSMFLYKVVSSIARGLLSLLAISFFASQSFGQTEDWTQFLGPDRNSVSSETGILTDWSGDSLKLNWTLPVGQGYAIGSVADGKYFHFDVTEGEKGNEARLRRIDLDSGKTDWTFSAPSSYRDLYGYDSGPRTSPLIHDGHVYAYGVEGMLWCINAESGDVIWEIDTMERFGVIQNFFGVSSSPIIHNDLLLVMVGGSPEESKDVAPGKLDEVKPNGSAVVALNRKTGEEVWRFGDDLASYTSLKIVDMHGQKVGLAWMRDNLLAFRPDDGKQLFEFKWRARKLESVNASTPVTYENKIYIGESYQKGGVVLEVSKDWQTNILWSDDGRRNKSLAPHWNTPVLHDGFLYGSSGERTPTAQLTCVEFLTGDVRWAVPKLGRSAVTFCDDHLIVLTEHGKLLLVKASSKEYELISSYEGKTKFRYPCWAAPVVSNGKLFVKGKEKVACFELK